MKQVSVEIEDKLFNDVDIAIKKSSFRNRTHLIEFLLQRFAYGHRFDKYKDVIQLLIILFGFSIVIFLIIVVG